MSYLHCLTSFRLVPAHWKVRSMQIQASVLCKDQELFVVRRGPSSSWRPSYTIWYVACIFFRPPDGESCWKFQVLMWHGHSCRKKGWRRGLVCEDYPLQIRCCDRSLCPSFGAPDGYTRAYGLRLSSCVWFDLLYSFYLSEKKEFYIDLTSSDSLQKKTLEYFMRVQVWIWPNMPQISRSVGSPFTQFLPIHYWPRIITWIE